MPARTIAGWPTPQIEAKAKADAEAKAKAEKQLDKRRAYRREYAKRQRELARAGGQLPTDTVALACKAKDNIPSTAQPAILKAVDIPLHQVEELSALGMTLRDIGYFYGLHPWTLELYRRQRPLLNEAYERGKAKGINLAADALNLQIRRGNIAAIIFYLKSRGNWREVDRLEVTGKKGGPLMYEAVKDKVDLTKLPTEELQGILNSLAKASIPSVPANAVIDHEEQSE